MELKRRSLGSRLGPETDSKLREIGTIWNHNKRPTNLANLDLSDRKPNNADTYRGLPSVIEVPSVANLRSPQGDMLPKSESQLKF